MILQFAGPNSEYEHAGFRSAVRNLAEPKRAIWPKETKKGEKRERNALSFFQVL
jgi:hypothetical protein